MKHAVSGITASSQGAQRILPIESSTVGLNLPTESPTVDLNVQMESPVSDLVRIPKIFGLFLLFVHIFLGEFVCTYYIIHWP